MYDLFNIRRLLSTAGTAALLTGAIAGLPAMAYAADVGEIVVTAQKRAQLAQDVPVSIYVATGEQLEAQGITSVQDFGNTVAAVNIASGNPGQMRLTIRGMGDISGSNQSSTVNGFYIDETAISYVSGYMPEVGLFDIERIEVLRGPQGTLFGDGSMGGTLRVITKKPDSTRYFGRYKLSGYSTEGGDVGFGAQASVNVPIQKDVLATTVSASYRKLPGWIDVPDLRRKDTNEADITDVRLAARYTPTAQLAVDSSYLYSHSKTFDFLGTSPGKLDPRTAGKAFGAGPVLGLSPTESELQVGAVTVSYDVGFATFISASAITKSANDQSRDLSSALPLVFPPSFLPGADAKFTYSVGSRALSQEFRLVSNGDKQLDWTVGAYIKDEKRTVDEGFVFTIPAITTVDAPKSHAEQKGTSWAVFGDADFAVNDRLSVQAGIRFFSDDKDFSVRQLTGSALPLGFAPAGDLRIGKDSATATSPKLGLTYKVNSKAMLFAKYAKGFRSGGTNTVPVKYTYAPSEYGPETVEAYEAGLKSELVAGWYLNAFVYHNDWNGLQLPFRTDDGVFGFTLNAGKASSDGAELETGWQIGEHLKTSLAYSYIDAAIDSDVLNHNGSVVAKAGSKIPLTSKNKIALSGSYTQELTDKLSGVLDARYTWASSNFTDPGNALDYKNGASNQLFIGLGLSGTWGSVKVFADNVLNEQTSLARFPPAGPPFYVLSNYARPRNFGISFIGSW